MEKRIKKCAMTGGACRIKSKGCHKDCNKLKDIILDLAQRIVDSNKKEGVSGGIYESTINKLKRIQ